MYTKSNKLKILLTRSLLKVDQDYISNGLKNIVGECFEIIEPKEYTSEQISKEVEGVDVLLGPFVTKEIINNAKNLKLIQIPWTGMDTFNFKDVKECDVPICNSHSNAAVVAEIGVGIIIDLLKKISYHDRKMRKGNWNRDQKPLDLKSRMLSQQKVCIIGYGSIGSKVGSYLKVFGTEIIAVNTPKLNIDGVNCFSSEEMMDAIKISDIVVVAVPLTDSTTNMIDKEFISQMKDDSFIVTLSRAGVVDEDALYDALISGKLAGYGSDVWWNAPKRGESESFVSNHNKFEELEQVVLSPHRAGFCENSLPHLDDVIVNIANLIEGKDLINVVKVESMY